MENKCNMWGVEKIGKLLNFSTNFKIYMCLFQATFVLVTIFTPLKFCLVFTYASIDVVFTKLQRKVYGIVTSSRNIGHVCHGVICSRKLILEAEVLYYHSC